MLASTSGGIKQHCPFGAVFIMAGTGVYTMIAARKISGHLHERLDETNTILSSHTNLLQEMGSSLKDLASSQKEMATTLKDISRKLDK